MNPRAALTAHVVDMRPAALAQLGHVLRDARARGPVRRELADLERLAFLSAKGRQEATSVDVFALRRDSDRMPPRLLSYRDTALALACSERQVQRLVADGVLPVVRLGPGTPRIRVSDLDTYVARLTPERREAV